MYFGGDGAYCQKARLVLDNIFPLVESNVMSSGNSV